MTTQTTIFTKEKVQKVIFGKIQDLRKSMTSNNGSLVHTLSCQQKIAVLMEILKKLEI
jgi:hypothetical protein